MKTHRNNYIKSKIIILISVLFIACDGEDGTAGFNSLISTEIEASGSNCLDGGIKVNTGLDRNRNNILESEEIQTTDYLCNGSDGIVKLDNLVRLNIGSPNFQDCELGWQMTEFNSWQLHDFNKNDYPYVKSIIFVPSLVNFEEGNTVTAELFNVTDNVPISGSQVIQDAVGLFQFKYSENIYEQLPNYPVSLSIRLKNKIDNSCSGTGAFSYLYILRE